MKRLTGVVCAAVMLGACSETPTTPQRQLEIQAPSLEAVSENVNEIIPTTWWQWIECANGGAGEYVYFDGNLHGVTSWTTSASGNTRVVSHWQPMGLTGTGEVTGDKYQATGVTQSTYTTADLFPITYTYVNNYRMIGPGPNNNFLVHETMHTTINANGEVKSEFDKFSVECK